MSLLISGSCLASSSIAASGLAMTSFIALLIARTRPFTASGFSLASFCDTITPLE